jgi:serine/threonine-protein kinase RsbW
VGTSDRSRPGLNAVFVALVVAVAYAIGSQLAFWWFDANGVNASFFPAAGVTMAALIIARTRLWPAVIAAAAAAELSLDLWHSIPLAPTLGYTAANLAQPLVGALLLGRHRHDLNLARLRSLALFLLCGVLAGPLAGGMIGATNNVVLDGGSGWLRFTFEWWVGDGLGVLVVGGTILGLKAIPPGSVSRPLHVGARLGESVALIVAAAGTTSIAFGFDWFALLYVPFALLFVIAVRTGTWGVALGGAAVAFVAAENTSRGNRLWELMQVDDATGLLYLQLGLAVIIACALVVAAGLSEREVVTIAYTTSDNARREAELARQRAELLGDLAETLGHAITPAEIYSALAERDMAAAWPQGARHDSPDQHPSVLGPARRMAEDAIERVRLITHEREARQRAELLEHHAASLAATATVNAVAEVTVRDLSTLEPGEVSVWAIRDRELVRLAVHPNGDRHSTGVIPIGAGVPVADCARRATVIVHPTHSSLLSAYPESVPATAPVETVVALPLHGLSGSVIGAILIVSAEPHWLTTTRRPLVVSLAGQCGLALDRAQLQFGVERDAADAELLARLSVALERATTVADRAASVVAELVASGASGATIELLEGDEHELVASAGGPLGTRSGVLVIPLQARGRTLGRLRIGSPAGGVTSRLRLVHDIATRSAIAIDNARLYETERDASHRLQVGLLDVTIPEHDGLAIAAAYRPGTATLDIGGDWHDAFTLPSGALGLVVGDVVGHGLDAAVAMAQLRGATRALAAVSSPSQLLDRLDDFVASLPDAQMTTLVYVELDPRTGNMRYACAGHPPPLVVSCTGVTRYLWGARSAPLGISSDEPRTEAVDRLQDAERLVLFTDGLVERRRESLDIGLTRLAEATRHDVSSGDFVERLCDEMLRGIPQADDICVLTVAAAGERCFVRHLTPVPMAVAGLRRDLRSWLQTNGGMEVEAAYEVLLAVSEAVSNSVEHGAGADTTMPIVVVAERAADSVSIVVRDHGTWREPVASPERGRGLHIMQSVMDHVSTERHADGTVVRLRRAV